MRSLALKIKKEACAFIKELMKKEQAYQEGLGRENKNKKDLGKEVLRLIFLLNGSRKRRS